MFGKHNFRISRVTSISRIIVRVYSASIENTDGSQIKGKTWLNEWKKYDKCRCLMIKCWGLSSQQRSTQLNTNMLDMLNERTSLRRMVNTPAVSFFVEVFFTLWEEKCHLVASSPRISPQRKTNPDICNFGNYEQTPIREIQRRGNLDNWQQL